MTQCQKQAFPFQCRMSLACTGGKFPRHSVEVLFGLALWAAVMVRVHALCFSPDAAVLESPKSNRVVTSGQGHHTRRMKLFSWRSSLINCPQCFTLVPSSTEQLGFFTPASGWTIYARELWRRTRRRDVAYSQSSNCRSPWVITGSCDHFTSHDIGALRGKRV